tara:strand:- start:188 stop:424 length:237 start_codon:yes stop_codon:yes gene_type:complete
MRSSGLNRTSLSVWHRLLLNVLTFDLPLNPLFLIHAVVRSVFFFGRLSALAKTYSFAIFGLRVGLCELQMCMAFSVGI